MWSQYEIVVGIIKEQLSGDTTAATYQAAPSSFSVAMLLPDQTMIGSRPRRSHIVKQSMGVSILPFNKNRFGQKKGTPICT
jgi:hypothetical protein